MPKRSVQAAERHRRDAEAFLESLRRFLRTPPAEGYAVDPSPSAVAAATGIDRTTLSKILGGTRLPTYEQMKVLQGHFHLAAKPPPGGASTRETGPVFPLAFEVGGQSPDLPIDDLSDEALASSNPGLAAYLARHQTAPAVTRRERYYLANTRVRVEPWISVDDRYWDALLTFWRGFLSQADQATELSPAVNQAMLAVAEVWDDHVAEAVRSLETATREVRARLEAGTLSLAEAQQALEMLLPKAEYLATANAQMVELASGRRPAKRRKR